MPDSQSEVSILLNIRAQNQAAIGEVQAQMAGLKAETDAAGVSAVNFSRLQQESAAAMNFMNSAAGKTASSFAPASAAQREFSLRAEETTVNAASLARGIDQLAAGAARAIPGLGGIGSEIRVLGNGAITTSGQVGVLNTILIGAGIAGALAFAAALAAIVTKGLEVQKTLQDVGAGVSGTLATNTDFGADQTKAAGPAAIQQITTSAAAAQVPITDLAKAFDQVFPAASRANTSISGLSNLLAKLISQEDALHVPQAKIVTDLEQIFNGSVKNTNQLAQQLGVTKEQATAWREAGTTTDELTAKTNQFATANQSSSESIARAQQTVSAAFEQLAAAAVKPIVQPLTTALNDLAAAMNNPSISAGASAIIAYLGNIAAACGPVIAAMQNVGKAIADAFNAAVNFAKNAPSLVPLGEGEGSSGGGPTAADNQNASLVTKLNAQEALAAKSRKSADGTILGQVTVDAPTGIRPPVGGEKGGGGGGGKAGPSQDTLDQKQISEIQSELNAKTEEYHSLIEQNNAAHLLGKTTLSEENAANLAATNSYITGIDQSVSKLQAMKAAVQAVADANGGLNVTEQKQLNNLDQQIAKMELLKAQAEVKNEDNSFFGQMDKQIKALGDDLALTGTKVGGFFRTSVNTAIDSTSQALTGLITGTKNWEQAFTQAADSILQNLIKIALQGLVGLAMQQSVGIGSRLESARTAAAGAYSSAAPIPYIGFILAPIAAALAFAAVEAFAEGGIISGSPSSRDNVLIHAASGEGVVKASSVQKYGVETIHAMNAGTFALGGIVPNFTPSFATGGIVGSFGTSGGGGTASGRDVNVNVFANQSDLVQHVLGHPSAEHHIVNILRKNRYQLKV